MCTLLTQNICLMCHTQTLGLEANQIGDAGLAALAKAVESGALAKCTYINLGVNQIGDAGLSALAGALSSGALSKLNTLFIDSPARLRSKRSALPRASSSTPSDSVSAGRWGMRWGHSCATARLEALQHIFRLHKMQRFSNLCSSIKI